jgi:hypothetical protein
MRSRLCELGVSKFAADQIRASVIDDVTLYPLIEELISLIGSGAVADLKH